MAWAGQAAYAVAALGVADLLHSGPLTAKEIAERVGADAGRLEQVMRLLESFGIFSRDAASEYSLTPMAAELRQEHWMHRYAILWGEQLYAAGGALLTMLRSGVTAFEVAHGKPIYDLYAEEATARNTFASFMSAVSDWQAPQVAKAIQADAYHSLVDVGGGRGSFVTAMLKHWRHLEARVLERPESITPLRERVIKEGLSDRCEVVDGDFFDAVPSGADLYTIKHVLHDWDDEPARVILKNIARAMPDPGRLLIIEAVCSPSGETDPIIKLRDVEQMIWTGGRVRTRGQWEDLLASASLQLERVEKSPVIDASLLVCSHR